MIGARAKYWLTWEQWLILVLAAAVLIPGAWWGLPNARRIELLLAGDPLSGDEMREITHLREQSRVGFLAKRVIQVDKFSRSEQAELIPRTDQTGELLTREERWRAFYDFASRSSAVDEGNTYSALARMRPRVLDLDPGIYIYGGSYLYPLGALLMALKLAGAFTVTRDLGYLLQHPSDMARIIVTGRYLNVLAFLASLALLARLGASLGGRVTAGVAMLGYAFSTVALNQAVVSKPHIYAAFFSLLSVYWLIRSTDGTGIRWLALSAAAAGWSAGASLPSALIALMYPVFVFRRADMVTSLRWLSLAGLIMGAMFVVTNPYALIRFDDYYFTLFSHASGGGWGYGQVSVGKLFGFLNDVFTKGYCFPVSLLAAGALLGSLRQTDPTKQRLGLATISMLVATGMTVAVLRITLFLGPLLSLFAGLAAAELVRWAGARWRPVAIAGLVVLFAPGAIFAGLFARDTIWSEAWYEPARAWLETVRPGQMTTFGTLGVPHPVNTPPFSFVHSQIVNLLHYSGANGSPEYVVLGNFDGDRNWWEGHSLRSKYELVATLGVRASYDWALRWRVESEARIAGWVYKRR